LFGLYQKGRRQSSGRALHDYGEDSSMIDSQSQGGRVQEVRELESPVPIP
jgi:hypothetical protein